MLLKVVLSSLLCLVAVVPAATIPPSRTITSSETYPDSGKINCWVSREGDKAVAVHIYQDDDTLKPMARVKTYGKQDGEFSQVLTTFSDGPNQYSKSLLEVELSRVVNTTSSQLRLYELLYKPTSTSDAVVVGWLRFNKGRGGRETDDAVLRLKKGSTAATPTGVPVVASSTPCDSPPEDDMGEEEEVTAAMSGGIYAPGPTLALEAPTLVVTPALDTPVP